MNENETDCNPQKDTNEYTNEYTNKDVNNKDINKGIEDVNIMKSKPVDDLINNAELSVEESIKTSKPEDFMFLKKDFSREGSTPLNEAIPLASVMHGDQITSSPTITFGQDTINMIDEFIKNEKQHKKKKSVIQRIIDVFKCC